MAKPTRAFRGPSIEAERQIQPLYRALASGIEAGNLAQTAVMPLMTAATTGGLIATMASAIAWWPTSLSFASSTATQTTSITHAMGRPPVGFLNVLFNPSVAGIAAASTGQWNSTAVSFAVASSGATVSYRLILL